MRPIWLCLAVGTLLGAGCKDKKDDGKAVSADLSARIEKLQAEEGDVQARRETLAAERKKVAADRAALAEKRQKILAEGGDVQAVAAEEKALADREADLIEQENQLDSKIETLLAQYQEMSLAQAGGNDVARREAAMAAREKDVARREEAIAKREAELALREKAQAQREKETCGTPAVTTIVQAPALPKGAKYSKRDVEPVLKKVRKRMSDKGLLLSDLPAPAQGLEAEATAAMAEGDFGRAKLAAEQLYATVDGMNIDKGFVQAKIGRLNALMKTKQLAEGPRKEVDELFRGATGDYGDGKFGAANGKLNKIYSLLR